MEQADVKELLNVQDHLPRDCRINIIHVLRVVLIS